MTEVPTVHAPTQRAGEMGPWWTLSIKAIVIIALPYMTWNTVENFKNKAFREAGDRWTLSDAKDQGEGWDKRFDMHIAQGGHTVMEQRMASTERNQEKILENQTEILVAVAKLQQQIEDMKDEQ